MLIGLILAITGLLLIYFEFFLPGGIMGVIGGALIIGAVIYVVNDQASAFVIIPFIVALLILIAITVRFAMYRIKKNKSKNSIYLDDDQEGYVGATYNKELIGKEGIAHSNLKPSGHILIDDNRYQAISEQAFIRKGEEILVIKGRGAYLIVRRKKRKTHD